MIEFVSPSSVPERHVACRLTMMMAGIGGPLAWEASADPYDLYIPSIIASNGEDNHVWDLGAGFILTGKGESGGFRNYQLTHKELDHELRSMQQFIEWALDQLTLRSCDDT